MTDEPPAFKPATLSTGRVEHTPDVDRSDAIIVRRTPSEGRPRRLRFEPRSDDRWEEIDEVNTGEHWRPTGSQVVDTLTIEYSGVDDE